MKRLVQALILLVVLALGRSAHATHFHGDTVEWMVPDPQGAPFTVLFTVTSGWTTGGSSAYTLDFGDGQSAPIPVGANIGMSIEAATGAVLTLERATLTHTYAGYGSYTAIADHCCRGSGLQNGSLSNHTAVAQVALTAGNTGGPVVASPTEVQMKSTGVSTVAFAAWDPDLDVVSCRFATAAESGLPAGQEIPAITGTGVQPTLQFTAGACQVTWDTSGSVAKQGYVLALVFESTHAGVVSSSPLEVLVEITTAARPTCNGGNYFQATVGQQLSVPTTGIQASGGGALTATMIGAPSGAALTPGGAGVSPFVNTFTWTPQASDAGTLRVVLLNYRNSVNVTGYCQLGIQVPNCAGFLTACTAGSGSCQASGLTYCNGTVPACNTPTQGGSPETCDGLDNDCNGSIDDGVAGTGVACSTALPGACASGTTACVGNGIACNPSVQPGQLAETCDGVDEDCDGTVDEGFNVGAICSAGVGACQAGGLIVCSGGAAACNATPGAPTTETCDGVDNNCDGSIDEGNPGGGGACTTALPGVCSAGTSSCGGGIVCTPTIAPGQIAEACNGLDDDCDGVVDEGFNLGAACTSGGLGVCQTSGVLVCNGASSACNAVQGTPGTETCDGLDNDCDGVADDGNPGGGQACSTGLPGACGAGVGSCVGGAPQCAATTQPGQNVETCNGLDDDCDGSVDEGFNVGGACTSGVGACAGNGVLFCNAQGAAACNATPKLPSAEVCDSLDNDCDGAADEGNPNGGAVCQTVLLGACSAGVVTCTGGLLQCAAATQPGQNAETCNAIDDDCDGSTDEGFSLGAACTSGLGACQVVGALVCDGQGAAACNAVAGPPSTELCGDLVDGDCDGDPDNGCSDTDGDGLLDAEETAANVDPNDADSDDDGVLDGDEPGWNVDTDADDLIGALDEDSDDDGLFDGTELGLACGHADTDAAQAHCIADADLGATTTDPLVADSDLGTVIDGVEDANHDGAIDAGETDPNDGSDDVVMSCLVDADCGGATSGLVCGDALTCIEGCRGVNGNGCPSGEACTSTDATIGACVPVAGCTSDAECGTPTSGKVCGDAGQCIDGCRGGGGNGCPSGEQCTSNDASIGSCVPAAECELDSDCGGATSGKVCSTGACIDGCRGENGNGCLAGWVCSSADATIGACSPQTGCVDDTNCGGPASARICDVATATCIEGCRGLGGNGCLEGDVCSSTTDVAGTCADGPPDPHLSYGAEGSGACSARPGGTSTGESLAWLAAAGAAIAWRRRQRRAAGRSARA